jgi:hypothetical protein
MRPSSASITAVTVSSYVACVGVVPLGHSAASPATRPESATVRPASASLRGRWSAADFRTLLDWTALRLSQSRQPIFEVGEGSGGSAVSFLPGIDTCDARH